MLGAESNDCIIIFFNEDYKEVKKGVGIGVAWNWWLVIGDWWLVIVIVFIDSMSIDSVYVDNSVYVEL